jgi:hypothetical protein
MGGERNEEMGIQEKIREEKNKSNECKAFNVISIFLFSRNFI